MAIPAFRAAGTAVFSANNVSATTNLSPTKNGSTVDGDLMVLITESRSNSATVSTPSGWNLVSGFPKASGTASGGKIYAYTRIANSGADDAPTVTWSSLTSGTSGDSCGARIISFSNATETADGTPPAANDAASTTSITIPAHTTSLHQSLVIGVAMRVNDTAHTFTTATFSERSDDHTTSGTGHGTTVAEKINASAGSSGTATVTPSNTTSSRTLAVSFGLKAAPTNVTLAQTTETDTAQAIAPARARALAQATEADTAQAITRAVNSTIATLAQATEANTAQAFGKQKTKGIAQATSTNTAQAIAPARARALAQATEADTAQAITRAVNSTIATLAQATEANTAQAFGKQKTKALAQTAEADAAGAVTPAKRRALAQVVEADTAGAVTPARLRALAQIAEADTAQTFGKSKARTLAQAVETDEAQQIIRATNATVVALARVTETSAAQAFGRVRIYALGQAGSTDTAGAMTSRKLREFGQAVEADAARAFTRGATLVPRFNFRMQVRTAFDAVPARGSFRVPPRVNLG